MTPTIAVRAASDLPACIAALRKVHERDAYPLTWPADPAAWLTPRGFLTAWVARRNDELIGHIALSADDDEPDRGPQAELKRLFVAPAARGTGAARALIDIALAACAARGLTPFLQVREGENTAIALYEATGWRRTDSYVISWPGSKGEHTVYRYERA